MLLQSLYVSIPVGANLHYFGDGSILQIGHQRISLNSVLTDFLTYCTGENTIESVCTNLVKEYSNRLPTNHESEIINKKIIDIIKRFTDNSFLVLSEGKQEKRFTITGVKGKYFPRKLTIELTNCCNLKCTHCFKEANCKNTNYLDISVIKDICKKYSGTLYEIQLTGGEPTLHPNINEIINTLAPNFRISLLTNGTELTHISDEALQLIRCIQISVYGYNKEIFAKVTDTNGNLFDNVGQSIKKVKTIHESRVTVVLNSFVMEHLEEYIRYAITYSAKEIKFSIASPMGRAIKSKCVSWEIDSDKQIYVEKELLRLHDKYEDKINVILWEDYHCSNIENIYELLNVKLPFCGAGGFDFCITESGKLKPCQILPESFELGDYTELDNIISSGIISQNQEYFNYTNKLVQKGIDPSLICPILRGKTKEGCFDTDPIINNY